MKSNKPFIVFGFVLVFILLAIALVSSAPVLSAPAFASTTCTTADTPKIKPLTSFDLNNGVLQLAEGLLFEHDFNLSTMPETNVSYAFAFLDKPVKSASISADGVLRLMPGEADVGSARIAIIAAKDSCADTLILNLNILDRPDIVYFFPENSSFLMNQTTTVVFKIIAKDDDADDSLLYQWFMDSKPLNGSYNYLNGSYNSSNDSYNITGIIFTPGFNVSGVHEIRVLITDSHNLSEEKTWQVQISKVNRPPVLINQIPGFTVFKNTETAAYGLNDYFKDPEKGGLIFSYKKVEPAEPIPGLSYANIEVRLDPKGFVRFNPATNESGSAYFIFTAYDVMNSSTESNLVKVDIIDGSGLKNKENNSSKGYCGDTVCDLNEDCTTCSYDCGSCGGSEVGCRHDWNCTEWSSCQPAGFQARNCFDANDCGDERAAPDTIKVCVYNATCFDGLKNGIEQGVDCGGPCETCPSCDDGLQNQGETGVDCGGICDKICPRCDDGFKNQNESDVDCGGQCNACVGGKHCLKNLDCESFRCDKLVCTFPKCNDTIKNQGEEGIDCGGLCPKVCGNCSDNIKNGGEEGIDCGGKCKLCPNCYDGLKNGNEQITDCGGDCRACTVDDYMGKFGVLIISLIIILAACLGLTAYLFSLINPEKARWVYDNNTMFTLIVSMNKTFRKSRQLRERKPALPDEVTRQFLHELTLLGKQINIKSGSGSSSDSANSTNKSFYELIIKFYTALLNLPADFDDLIFLVKLKESRIPLLMKVLLSGYYKKSEILSITSFLPAEQKADLITEMKFLLLELAKG